MPHSMEQPIAPLAEQVDHASVFSFNNTWQILGPFQTGTRGTLIQIQAFKLLSDRIGLAHPRHRSYLGGGSSRIPRRLQKPLL